MADVGPPGKSVVGEDEDDNERSRNRNSDILSSLRQEEWFTGDYVYEYRGFWYPSMSIVEGVMWVQQNFKPRREDILLVTLPKAGTTWFKSLMFAVMNRTRFHDLSIHPLLTTSPHDLVPFLEFYLHHNIPFPDPDTSYPPQLFHAHIPFTLLSEYVLMESQCRIVYVCRNPKDVFVSGFYFSAKVRDKKPASFSLEKAFELFCKGVFIGGPFWDHVLGYWKASLEMPERVLFIKYEDMKRDSSFHLKRLAEFMGYPFSVEEEKQGVVHDILELCGFENLSNYVVNKTGEITTAHRSLQNHTFFRKGEVGDWKRHLTAEMADRLNKLTDQKLAGSGLTFHDLSEA